MTDTFDIETIGSFELLTSSARLITEADVTALADTRWLELTDAVILLASQTNHLTVEQRWLEFKQLFYSQWRFKMATEEYFSLPSNSFSALMVERQGNNVVMALVVAELLTLSDIEIALIDFPGPLVLRLGGDNGIYVDPLNGEQLDRAMLECLVRGHLGDHLRLEDQHLVVAGDDVIKKRFLISVKQACLLAQEFEIALTFNQLLLDISPDDPQQRMERGFVLQQLECFKGASDDFSFFIENCPDDPNSDVLKMHMKVLELQNNTYH